MLQRDYKNDIAHRREYISVDPQFNDVNLAAGHQNPPTTHPFKTKTTIFR